MSSRELRAISRLPVILVFFVVLLIVIFGENENRIRGKLMNLGEYLIWKATNGMLLIPVTIGLVILTRRTRGRIVFTERDWLFLFGHPPNEVFSTRTSWARAAKKTQPDKYNRVIVDTLTHRVRLFESFLPTLQS